jgi:hypothetical protein
VSAVEIGVSKDFAFYIIAISNAASAVGRLLTGIIGDKIGMFRPLWTKDWMVKILIGPINVMAPATALAGIMTFVWPFAKDEFQLIVITSIYGFVWQIIVKYWQLNPSRFSCGAYISLFTMPAVAMGKIEDAGRRVGMFMSLTALGAIAGPPISGALISPTGGFMKTGYCAGMFLKCVIF